MSLKYLPFKWDQDSTFFSMDPDTAQLKKKNPAPDLTLNLLILGYIFFKMKFYKSVVTGRIRIQIQ